MASGENSQAGQKAKEQWLAQVTVHYKAKQYDLALAACENILNIDPRCALAPHKKGLIFAKLVGHLPSLVGMCEAELKAWKETSYVTSSLTTPPTIDGRRRKGTPAHQ
ncbi:MAG TPA: hypothetical protein VFV38_23655, partial [Ktedonobacteraceae bacterium]|nr:hypothetical protein [Ktedonobacteraceae bacterium]